MSKARDAIVELIAVLRNEPGPAMSDEDIADLIMPIVRDAVARGFETAARVLQDLDDEPHAARHLRDWANIARSAS